MWNEIKDKAKIELMHILFMAKLCKSDETSIPQSDEITPETFSKVEKPSLSVLQRWKCIIDLFDKNGFI